MILITGKTGIQKLPGIIGVQVCFWTWLACKDMVFLDERFSSGLIRDYFHYCIIPNPAGSLLCLLSGSHLFHQHHHADKAVSCSFSTG